jgi:hypothetical protein
VKTVKVRARFDEPIAESVVTQAVAEGCRQAGAGVHASAVQYLSTYGTLVISFADQSAISLPTKNYPELAELSQTDLEHLSLGFGGSALCLDEHDLHVSIAGLV